MLPLKKEINEKLKNQFDFVMGHPAEINKWTRKGEVNAAPCSSICLLKYPELQMKLPIGIAACKDVQSVYIGFAHYHETLDEFVKQRMLACQAAFKQAIDKHPTDLRAAGKHALKLIFDKKVKFTTPPIPIYFTAASETSVALAKLVWRFLFGWDVFEKLEKSTAQGGAHVLIGDEALEKKNLYPYRLDLASLWNQLTGLPFVFAVWQSAMAKPHSGFRDKLIAAADLAQARMKIEPCTYFSTPLPKDHGGQSIDLAGYWRNIHYHLTKNDMRGLILFLALVCESQPKYQTQTNKILSLQEIEVI